jgi:hypothetical protein
MKLTLRAINFLLVCALLIVGCEKQPLEPLETTQQPLAFQVEVEPAAIEILSMSGWDLEGANVTVQGLAKGQGYQCVTDFQRSDLGKNIVHYKFVVRTGPGVHDIIGIHRVVKEDKPCKPTKAKDAIFLLHGDAKNFEGMWLPWTKSSNTPYGFGLAMYLAENNVDVWGIDQAWTFVPANTTDFSFMKDWGVQRQLKDLLSGVAIARAARMLTGNGCDPMITLGYSSGGITGYAALNYETQLPASKRQIRGFICADMCLKTDDAAMRSAFVNDMGMYSSDEFAIPFQQIGNLARTDPTSDSPMFPGFTNLQVALWYASAQILGPDVATHYLAGFIDNDGMPTGFRLVTLPQWLDFLEAGIPYEPSIFEIDIDKLVGEVGDSPFDDHLGEIKVPILHLAAKGGFGPYGARGLAMLGSPDKTTKIVQIGTGNSTTELGHIDLFIAPQAPSLAWDPMLKWLKAHRN